MNRSLPQITDQAEAEAAIDQIAAGFKALHRIWLARRDHHQVDAGAGELGEITRTPIAETSTPQSSDGLMTLQEAAKFLHVSEQTIHAWRKRGVIEGLQYGEEWRFDRDELISDVGKTQASKK